MDNFSEYNRGHRNGRRAHRRGSVDSLHHAVEGEVIKPITLSITTRGIGLGTCHLAHTSSFYRDIRDIRIPNIYSLYRVFLGLVEKKLHDVKLKCPFFSRLSEHSRELRLNSDTILRLALMINVTPEPIRKIINAIGFLEHEGKIYLPAVAAEPTDPQGAIVPRPEALLLSSLRRTVVALADPTTPLRVREQFYSNNPIPGAIWRDKILLNHDEIIPADYNFVDDFHRDLLVINPFCNMFCNHVQKLAGGTLDSKSTGKPSLFISNQMGDLRAPDRNPGEELDQYYRRCVPEGNVRYYYALARLSSAERLEGRVNLLGEYPDPVYLRYPFYHMRDENAAAFEMYSDYLGSCNLVHSNY